MLGVYKWASVMQSGVQRFWFREYLVHVSILDSLLPTLKFKAQCGFKMNFLRAISGIFESIVHHCRIYPYIIHTVLVGIALLLLYHHFPIIRVITVTQTVHGCFNSTVVVLCLSQWQWNSSKGNGENRWMTHCNKTPNVWIILGIYCRCGTWVRCMQENIDGLMQDFSNNRTMELLQSCHRIQFFQHCLLVVFSSYETILWLSQWQCSNPEWYR